MDRPLWQIFLAMILAAHGLVRAGTGVVLYVNDDPTGLFWSHAVQAAGGLLGAIGMWMGGRARTTGLVGFAVALGAAAALEAALGLKPAFTSVAQMGAVFLGVGVLVHLVRIADATDEGAS